MAEQKIRLYNDLASWFPLLTPVDDYAEEAAFYKRLFETHAQHPPRTLLDLGSGGGHNAAHLKRAFDCTLLDQSSAMLDQSRRLNPDCAHVEGDLRTVRLGRVFDAVLVHDAVSYMTTLDDLSTAIATAFAHTARGGVVLFHPDFVAETFDEDTDTGGSDQGMSGVRYLEWRWRPDPNAPTYVSDMAYLLRQENGATEVAHDRHVMGLFPRAVWIERIAAAGFEPLAVPFEHSHYQGAGYDVFIARRPAHDEGEGAP